MIKRRKKYMELEVPATIKEESNTNYDLNREELKKIFVDCLLQNNKDFNSKEVRDHITMIIAGSETTAYTTANISCKFIDSSCKLFQLRFPISHDARNTPKNPGKSLCRTQGSFLLG